MTTLAPIQAPADLIEHLETTPRSQAIDDHGFDLNLLYWNNRIGHLPGGPVRGVDGSIERGRITRGSLFAMADGACTDESAEAAYALLWHVLAWGTGTSHRNTTKRVASIERNVAGIGEGLRRAAILSRTDPQAAFRTLQPHKPLVGSLGPNFFTKYLYFAGAGNIEHPCLIVDKRVLATLSRSTEEPLTPKHGSGYGYRTYSAANNMMSEWARQLSTPDRQIGFDEVERWAFKVGK
ncbi:hypothetical protein ACFY5D_17250 [Paeniglutamicibacter sp. NPDC012692]|uniref:8-oxoguanine DNA glycosylase OGG fold protein n=1 Tax=Paeniglutamicibacter sp. NPDC012692 TaxID=3364388 RepID=UPI00368514AE